MSMTEIADRLGRAPSTIYREVKRNMFIDKEWPKLDGYYGVTAHGMSEDRRAIHRKMIRYPRLKMAVEDRLRAGWSPQQIAGRMRYEQHLVKCELNGELRVPRSVMDHLFSVN